MILTAPALQTVDRVDRRALGAFRFVDAVTQLPVVYPMTVEVRGATLIDALNGNVDVPLGERSVRLQQTRSGVFAILRAPFFDAYTETFEDPQSPADLQNRPLRLRFALTNAGPSYLPQEFTVDLPRSLDPGAADSVLLPQPVAIFRAPAAPVLDGWVVVRASVADANTGAPLPGVLVRVFASPRAEDDLPLGQGMTEWRGNGRGEALVPVAGVPRFRPGAGQNVFETAQAVHFEAVRDPAFTGATGQGPDGLGISAGTVPGVVLRRSDQGPGPLLTAQPPAPLDVRSGREIAVRLAMP